MTEHTGTAFEDLGPNQILDAVDAGGWVTDGRVTALNSYENRVYQIGLDDGSSVIGKFYRPRRWTDSQIQEEHDFSAELAETDITVVCPIRNADLNTLHYHGTQRYAVFPRAGGRPPELDNPEQLEVIGRTIGRLHLVGETAKFHHRLVLDPRILGDDSVLFLSESELLPSASKDVYLGVSRDILSVVHQHFSTTDYRPIRIHGDFHPGNILWGSDETPHILDLDDTCTGPAIQDLWMFISGDRPYATARLADLLEGYTQFRDFDPAELALIEPLRALRLLHYAAWIARRWEDPAFKIAFPFFAEARFWDEHILSLREQRAQLDEKPLVWD